VKNKTVTLPYLTLRAQFKLFGFTDDEITSVMTTLVMLWRANELYEDITKEYVFTELDLDELSAQMLWNAVSLDMLAIAGSIRTLAGRGQLIRWVVYPYTILLEISHEANYP